MKALIRRRQAGILTCWGVSALLAARASMAAAANLPIMHDDARDLLDIIDPAWVILSYAA